MTEDEKNNEPQKPDFLKMMTEAADFLCRRLEDFERELSENEVGREYYGHVHPAYARLVAVLAAMEDDAA